MSSNPRIALITGANQGIGKEIARILANDPSTTPILACLKQAKETADELGLEHSVYLDLTDPSSMDACAQYIEDHFDGKLDILINNAAICFNDPTLYGKVPHTPFEKQVPITIQTNYFGTKYLTMTLLPKLIKSADARIQAASKSQDDSDSEDGYIPRILTVTSSAGRLGILKSPTLVQTVTDPSLSLEDLDALMAEFVQEVETGSCKTSTRGWPSTCYGMSKLGLIAMTKILARHHPTVLVHSIDPGYCATEQNLYQGTRPPELGALTPCWLALSMQAKNIGTGKHWFDKAEIPWSYGEEIEGLSS